MAHLQRFLRASSWRAVILRVMAFVLLIAAIAPHVPAYAAALGAETVAVSNDLDDGQQDPALPGAPIHHCAQCPCHPVARTEASVAALPASLTGITYAALLYERPPSLAPAPLAPPPRS